MQQPASSSRQVRCPGCGKRIEWREDNPWRPFCSERCRKGDLAAWASDQYRVPAAAPDPGLVDEGPET